MQNIKQIITALLAIPFRASTKFIITIGCYNATHKVVATYAEGKMTLADGIDEISADKIFRASVDPNGIFITNDTIEIYTPFVTEYTLGLTAEQYSALRNARRY